MSEREKETLYLALKLDKEEVCQDFDALPGCSICDHSFAEGEKYWTCGPDFLRSTGPSGLTSKLDFLTGLEWGICERCHTSLLSKLSIALTITDLEGKCCVCLHQLTGLHIDEGNYFRCHSIRTIDGNQCECRLDKENGYAPFTPRSLEEFDLGKRIKAES